MAEVLLRTFAKNGVVLGTDQKHFETARTAAKAAATLPESDLRKIVLDGLAVGLFVCDAQKRGFPIVQIDGSFTAITGYTSEQAIGAKLNLLYGSLTDADTVKAVGRALSHGRPMHAELLCYRANGTTVWCELIAVPKPTVEGPHAYFAMGLKDISERKQHEEQLREQEANCRRIFDNAVEGIYQSTPEGRYLQVNLALARMYGYRDPDALMNQISDIQNQIYVDPCMREKFKNLINEADEVRGLEYQVRRRDGRIIWISENARVVRDGSGRARYYEGFIEEITRRKETEAALQHSQQKLIETSRQVGLVEMANGILHNVGNALSSVNVSAGLIASKVTNSKIDNLPKAAALLRKHEKDLTRFVTHDPKGRQLIEYFERFSEYLAEQQTALQDELKTLKKSLEHANEIISFQQNYAKGASRAETITAVELVEDAIRMSANSLTRHHVQIVRDYGSELPEVTVQKHLILQVLLNLIRNGQKACENSESPERRLTLRLSRGRKDRHVRIEVRDTGVGIPKENLTRLFQHGFTTRKDGHGFGLHSGARIAHQLGGSLTAHSDGIGKGASFILEFPCHPPAQK